jgi:hypothetical protein
MSGKVKYLSSHQIPVEIFILFLVKNRDEMTVGDVIRIFEQEHKIKLSYNRVNQIVNDFVISGKFKKEYKAYGQKGKQTAYYTFLKIG